MIKRHKKNGISYCIVDVEKSDFYDEVTLTTEQENFWKYIICTDLGVSSAETDIEITHGYCPTLEEVISIFDKYSDMYIENGGTMERFNAYKNYTSTKYNHSGIPQYVYENESFYTIKYKIDGGEEKIFNTTMVGG